MLKKSVVFQPESSNQVFEYSSYNNCLHDENNSSNISNNNNTTTLNCSNYSANKTKFQNRHSPPFRPNGRGSKMLAKAIEQSNTEQAIVDESFSETSWVLCTGKTPCFAKVISMPNQDTKNVLIQPLHPNIVDPSLLVPWEGHLWLAKSNKLHPVQVN